MSYDDRPTERDEDGAKLLDDVKTFLARFVVYPTEHVAGPRELVHDR